MQAEAKRKAEYDALKFARRSAGDPEREQALLATFKGVYAARKEDKATSLFRQRLFINAARLYVGIDEPWAKVAAAVSYTLALHPLEAVQAWRTFLAKHADSPLAVEAHRHLADLFVDLGDFPAAAELLEALAASWPKAGAVALRRAIELRGHSRAALRRDLEMFVRTYPKHADTPALTERLRALDVGITPAVRPPGPPPSPIAACRQPSCLSAPFWPPTSGPARGER